MRRPAAWEPPVLNIRRGTKSRLTRAEASRERRLGRAAAGGRRAGAASPHAAGRGGSRPAARPPRRRSMPAPRRMPRSPAWYERAAPWPGALLPSLPSVRLEWRVASLAIVIVFGALTFYLMSTPTYFVNSVNLAGAVHVPAEEIYEASGLHRMHVFWIEPEVAQANVEKVPGIASAIVELHWPNVVNLTVVEREPMLAWQQGSETMWVDRDGVLFPARGEIAGLLPVVVDDAQAPLDEGQTVPVKAIVGALQLRTLRPNIELLHYDALRGLSYQDGRGWRGYFGVGADMEVKLAVYETLVADLIGRSIQPTAISVSNPEAPYYRK